MCFFSKVILKHWVIENPRTSRSAVFQNAQRDVLGFFKIYQCLICFEEKKQGIILSTWPNLSHGWTLTGCKNWSWTILSIFFWWKSLHWRYKCVGLVKISHTKHFTAKRDTFPKTWFFRKSNCTDTFEQSPTMHNYFGAKLISKLNHLNANGHFYVNLVHWNSLHPKNAILPTFLGQHHIFSVKITKPELTTYTIGKLGLLWSFWA